VKRDHAADDTLLSAAAEAAERHCAPWLAAESRRVRGWPHYQRTTGHLVHVTVADQAERSRELLDILTKLDRVRQLLDDEEDQDSGLVVCLREVLGE